MAGLHGRNMQGGKWLGHMAGILRVVDGWAAWQEFDFQNLKK